MDLTRRRFVVAAGALGAAALSPLGPLAADDRSPAEPAAASDSQPRTISKLPHRYHGWPTVAQAPDGELLVVCSGGRQSHVCPFGRIELMRSKDHGASWSWPRVLLDGPIDDRDAGVLVTSKGTILVTTFTSLAYVPLLDRAGDWPEERKDAWLAAHNRVSSAQRQKALGVWMIRSTDGGRSFSAPYRSEVNSPHGPIEMSDGALLYAGKRLWDDEPRVGVCRSDDDGQTWKWTAEIPTRPGDDFRQYHELHAVHAANGELIVQIRNHNSADSRETLQCHSSDGGRTWSTPRSIGVWGLPSHLLRLEDDRLLMSYGHRRPPFGNQARVSEDHGRTWSEPITISDDGAGGDLGYPSTVQLPDGKLLTVWYEKLAGSSHAVLRQRTWDLA